MTVVGARFGGQVSPGALLADALDRAEEYERAIVIVKWKGTEEVVTGQSHGSVLEAIGMLEAAKDFLLKACYPRDGD